MQEEFAATGQQYVMYRPFLHALRQAFEERQVKQLLLEGMPGAGKSIAVATLAHWARQAGWVVRTASSPGSCSGQASRSCSFQKGHGSAQAAGRLACVCSMMEVLWVSCF